MKKILMATLSLLIAVLFIHSLPAQSKEPYERKSQCRGLSYKQCERKDGCTWQKAFKTQKGKMVKAHCRSKPK